MHSSGKPHFLWNEKNDDQLLHIAEDTGSKIYTRESEAGTHSQAKALVLSLKQYHTHYFKFYKKGTTGEMVVSKDYTQAIPSSTWMFLPG